MAATSRGMDVSEAQSAQDWAALRRGGLTFAMCKATEGVHFNDARYGMHMRGMRAAGILPGAYHFAWPNQSARVEADHYIGVVRADADAVPGFHHWLDLERNPEGTNYAGCSAAEIRAYAEAWIARVKAAFPRQRVGVYTSADDIKTGRMPRTADALWYPAYPAGPLTYTQAEQRSRPTPSAVHPLFWQFADAPTDRSIAYLTPAGLRAWAGATTPPTPAPHQEDTLPTPRDVWAYTHGDRPDVHATLAAAARDSAAGLSALRALTAQVAAQSAAITALAQQLGKGGDVARIVSAVQAAIAESVVHVEITGEPVMTVSSAVQHPAAPATS
jgi:GH25 family lysozyme M1 (1,4-beta-N-acetylmuramidase)